MHAPTQNYHNMLTWAVSDLQSLLLRAVLAMLACKQWLRYLILACTIACQFSYECSPYCPFLPLQWNRKFWQPILCQLWSIHMDPSFAEPEFKNRSCLLIYHAHYTNFFHKQT